MKTCLIVITDGRKRELQQCLITAALNLPKFDTTIIYNDRLDINYKRWLDENYGYVVHSYHKAGFAGAIQNAWRSLPKDTDYVFHLEEDFTFNRPVPLDSMIAELKRDPFLAQVALKRQAWNEAEKKAGGIVEQWPHLYNEAGQITKHKNFFTTNPSVYPYALTKIGWPDAPDSERKFTDTLLEQGYHFAFWGKKFDAPMVTHIGHERPEGGTGY